MHFFVRASAILPAQPPAGPFMVVPDFTNSCANTATWAAVRR